MSAPELVVSGVVRQGQSIDFLVAMGKVLDLLPHDSGRVWPESYVVDGRGLILMPSFIDAHVHLREPGLEYKEDIASGLAAAAWGGFGQVLAMANTCPVNDNAAVTAFILRQAQTAWPHGPWLRPVGGLTIGLAGKELAPLGELARAGCVAFSNDGNPVADAELFRRAMEYAAGTGVVIIDHCEDLDLSAGGVMNEGYLSGLLGLKGQPAAAEAIQVARDILLAEYLDLPIHLAHVSCRQAVECISWAKARGVRITAETCPHYLVFTEKDVDGYTTAAKVNPPLRTVEDRDALRWALASGVIDSLATDHAPHAIHEKETPFDEALFGISGLDTALSLTWRLVQDGALDAATLERAWCHAPATIFGLPYNRFKPGDPADFFLFDPVATWEVTARAMYSKGKNTPCLGTTLTGQVRAHYLGGRRILGDRVLSVFGRDDPCPEQWTTNK
ncbi:Dihydroorotase [Desulfovibrionales bacterium]